MGVKKSCKKYGGKEDVGKVVRDKFLVCKNLIRGYVKMRCKIFNRVVHNGDAGNEDLRREICERQVDRRLKANLGWREQIRKATEESGLRPRQGGLY